MSGTRSARSPHFGEQMFMAQGSRRECCSEQRTSCVSTPTQREAFPNGASRVGCVVRLRHLPLPHCRGCGAPCVPFYDALRSLMGAGRNLFWSGTTAILNTPRLLQ